MSASSKIQSTEFIFIDARGKGAAYTSPWQNILGPRVDRDYRRQLYLWVKPYDLAGNLKPFEQSCYVVKAQMASVTICPPRKVNGVLLNGTCVVYADFNSVMKYGQNGDSGSASDTELTENLLMLSQLNPDDITIKLCERDHPLSMNPQPVHHNNESSLTKVRVTVQGASLKARIDLENVQTIKSEDMDSPLENRPQSPASSKKRKSGKGTSYPSASSDAPRLTSPNLIEQLLNKLDAQARENAQLLKKLVTQNEKDGHHRQQYPPPQPEEQMPSTSADLSRSMASYTLPVRQSDNHNTFRFQVDPSSPNFQFDNESDQNPLLITSPSNVNHDACRQSFYSNGSAQWNQGQQ